MTYIIASSNDKQPHTLSITHSKNNKNSSGDEIANVNFYAQKVLKFAEITQNNGHYAVQGHSRSPILVPIESSYTISY